ncbi:MAG: helix-turn-helix transcriptional regulator [Beijerinckiaceae bacterium]
MKKNRAYPLTGWTTARETADFLHIGLSSLWLAVQQGRLPAPVKFGPKTTRFAAEQIRAVGSVPLSSVDVKSSAELADLERQSSATATPLIEAQDSTGDSKAAVPTKVQHAPVTKTELVARSTVHEDFCQT